MYLLVIFEKLPSSVFYNYLVFSVWTPLKGSWFTFSPWLSRILGSPINFRNSAVTWHNHWLRAEGLKDSCLRGSSAHVIKTLTKWRENSNIQFGMNECMHQLMADLVNILLFYFDSQKKAGSLNIFLSIFSVLKYRRQFKWRQQIMGLKVVSQFFFPS